MGKGDERCVVVEAEVAASSEAYWEREAEARGRSAKGHGRPTIPMRTYVRLMVLEHRHGWGCETLMREVSDSFHVRRFCLIAIDEQVGACA